MSIVPDNREWTDEEIAEFKRAWDEAVKQPLQYTVVPRPPLTQDETRALLRECVTVVAPGEVLVLRCAENWTPSQVRQIQEYADGWLEYNASEVKVLVVPAVEMAVLEAAAED